MHPALTFSDEIQSVCAQWCTCKIFFLRVLGFFVFGRPSEAGTAPFLPPLLATPVFITAANSNLNGKDQV
jgi:hypothetical protein